MLLGEGRPNERGGERGEPPKRRYFTAIGSSSVKMVADWHRHAAYHNKHWQRASYKCQHRWPWVTLNPQNRSLVIFSRFRAATHISTVNCSKMA